MSDHSWGDLPEARVLRDGTRPVPPQVGRAMRAWVQPGPRAHVLLSYAVGLWPLLAITALAVAMLWSAGLRGSP